MSAARTVLRVRARIGTDRAHDLTAEIASGVTVGAFADAVAAHVGAQAHQSVTLERTGTTLRGDQRLLAAGVRNGDTLTLGAPRVKKDDAQARFDLVVVGGPVAGKIVSLPAGTFMIGRDESCDVTLADPSMSRKHLRVKVSPDTVIVVDPGSNNGTFVRDTPLRHHEPYTLSNGERLRLARSLISIRPSRPRHDALGDDGAGNVAFNRPPRVPRRWQPQRFQLPAPPGKATKARLPLAASLAPLLMGAVMYAVTKSPLMLLFMALTPVLAIWTWVEDRRGGKKASAEQLARWEAELAKLGEQLQQANAEEEHERNAAAPDAGELIHRAVSHTADLWERRPTDPDFLHLRVGTADQPARYEVTVESGGEENLRHRAKQIEGKQRTVPAAPVLVAVPEAGAVGLGGSPQGVTALSRWLLAQAVTLHSPRELMIAAAVREELVPELGWLKWTPHTRPSVSPLEGEPLAVGPTEARRLVEDVIALQRRRREDAERLGAGTPGRGLFVLLVLDERVAPERSLVAQLLGATGKHDIAVLWLGREMRELPGECRVTIEHDDRLASVIVTDARTGSVLDDVTVDGLSRGSAREIALALAPVRDTSTSGARGGIPSRITLLELLNQHEHTPDEVVRRWQTDHKRTLAAPLGATGDQNLTVDLRADGPHALIGGTTGAGKSELLQTLVASLALEHPPTRLTFLLVDYKGGAAFKECVGLPHTVGFVTDLDAHLTQRALISLNAELKRREHVLKDAGAKDLMDMERRTADAPPSLVIVIDEFATLAKEVPEFVEGVVDVAQRGRSLGVHLVLATQRPGGVVSENIRANVNLRIALRMAAPTESADVVGVVDAARISRTTPGRALARVGQADLEEFQAAYVGGLTTAAGTGPAIELREFGFGPPAGAEAQPSRPSTAFGTVSTDLEELVKAVNVANEREQHPPQSSPWLPALEPVVPLATLPPSADPAVTFGLIDEPALQRQVPLTHDFEQDGSMLVYGASGTGKTALLRTIAVSLAAQTPPDRLQLYGLDFATRGLTSLEALPHCGGVVLGEDEERVARLLNTIGKTLATRRERFAARGAFTLSEYNRAVEEHEALPRIVILFDGYAGFFSTFERINLGELVDLLPRLVADSRPLGVHFVITAERRATISGQLSGIVPTKVVLRMADPDEYGSLGLDTRVTKEVKLPAGRGFAGGVMEAQVALVGDDPSGEGQLAAIGRAAHALRARFGEGHVPPIAPLPASVPRDDLPPASPLRPILGLGDDDLDSLTVDLTEAHFVVAGPYRSGRSTALETVARSLLDGDPGIAVHLLAPRRSPLPAADVGWTSVSRGVEACDAKAAELAALAADLDEGDPPLVIVIDDGDELAETLGSSALETLVRRGRDAPVRIVAATETQAMLRAYGGWLRELRKDEHGLLLDPDLDVDGDLLGVRLPRRTNAVFPAGRGYYVWRGALELVQVAH